MYPSIEIAQILSNSALWLGQTFRRTEPAPIDNTAMVLSGPQFFTSLIAGVLLAFAFQLLLTNLGVATGISLIGREKPSLSDYEQNSESLGTKIRKISVALGLGTLVSVTLALFLACLLAVKLSLFASPGIGAIVGLVIWATYFSLLVFFSSTTVGSLIGSVINTATSGFQAILGTSAAAIGSRSMKNQAVSTAEALADTVRKKLGSALEPETVREKVENYFQALRPKELNLEAIAADFERLIEEEKLPQIADRASLGKVNRQIFVDLISNRSDLSPKDINRIADKLETVWNKKVRDLPPSPNKMAEFASFLQSATRSQLIGQDLSDRLDSLTKEMQKQPRGVLPATGTIAMGFGTLLDSIMRRTDLSDLDVDRIIARLEKVKDFLGEGADKIAPRNPIEADVKSYLLHAHSWQLKPESLDKEFRDILYDPQADPQTVANYLKQIDRADFTEWLEHKGIFTRQRISKIANKLEEIRQEVLEVARAAIERERAIALLIEVQEYLRDTSKPDLSPEKIQFDFKPILEDRNADYETLRSRLQQFDRLTFERQLRGRNDLSEIEVSTIASELEMTRNHILKEAEERLEAVKIKVDLQWRKLLSYLSDTSKKELDLQALAGEVQTMLEDPHPGADLRKVRKERFDRSVLVRLLGQRQDLSQERIEQIVERLEMIWVEVPYAIETVAGKAQEKYQQAISAIGNYLQSTGKEELNSEAIQKDLNLLLKDPKTGFSRIGNRLSAIDRETWVKLLAQRQDLSEEQINQIIDRVQTTLGTIAKTPRRLARRAREGVRDFSSAIADYLASTEKEELNPEGIERDLQLLLSDPRAGVENFKERLSHFDRDTLVALLARREDLSTEEANRIVDRILEVRDRFIAQLQEIQNRIQAAIDRVLERIRNYLNSLERPELNYDGIRNDVHTLLNDPQAGFDALRDRFSQLDRDTLIAILSSREDISKADAERLVGQVEKTRDRLLQRAELVQQEIRLKVEELKLKAQQQAEETRKAAAVASWWLFFTALISAVASASAGALAVAG